MQSIIWNYMLKAQQYLKYSSSVSVHFAGRMKEGQNFGLNREKAEA